MFLKKIILLLFFFQFTFLFSFAEEPKIIEYNKDQKKIKIELDGKQYELDIPIEENLTGEITPPPALKAKIEKKEYARGPLSTTIGQRLYSTLTDNLLKKHGFSYDFTHRFSTPISKETSGDVYGLDSFAYTGIGINYGILDNLEAHVFRTSVLDATEFGLKLRLLREAKKFGTGSPFGLVVHGGFQNDNIQNSIDPYIQTIFSKVIINKWLKVYASPTLAWKSPTLGNASSKSAIFFSFNDPKNRKFKKHGETFAIPIGTSLQILPNKLSFFGEYIPVISGFKENKNGWAYGLQLLSRNATHVWTFGVSNMPYTTTSTAIVGAPNNDWHIGFNITAMIK